ncbi:hypothetical protein MKX03_022438 [Papaver bracteatum]|nr:hypothetical protein MKX03_022438 [Papaver bracteatum]
MERNFRNVFSAVFFFVLMILVSTTAERRKKIIECVDKRSDFGLTEGQFAAFQQIVNAELMKEPLEYKDDDEKKKEKEKVFREIEASSQKDEKLKDLKKEKVDIMILAIGIKDKHCTE